MLLCNTVKVFIEFLLNWLNCNETWLINIYIVPWIETKRSGLSSRSSGPLWHLRLSYCLGKSFSADSYEHPGPDPDLHNEERNDYHVTRSHAWYLKKKHPDLIYNIFIVKLSYFIYIYKTSSVRSIHVSVSRSLDKVCMSLKIAACLPEEWAGWQLRVTSQLPPVGPAGPDQAWPAAEGSLRQMTILSKTSSEILFLIFWSSHLSKQSVF